MSRWAETVKLPKFVVGSHVKIIKKGSSTSCEHFGKIVQIIGSFWQPGLHVPYYNVNVNHCHGVWENELELAFSYKEINSSLP